MLNGVSDFIDQNRRRSSVRVTVVALSSALDVSGSPPPLQHGSLPHKCRTLSSVHQSLPGARARAHAAYDDAVSRYVAGSDGQKLIEKSFLFKAKVKLQIIYTLKYFLSNY